MDPVIHPGVFLNDSLMVPLGLTQGAVAAKLAVSEDDLRHVLSGERAVTTALAEKLGQFFDMTPGFWTEMQSRYDVSKAPKKEIASPLPEKATIFHPGADMRLPEHLLAKLQHLKSIWPRNAL